ncbi:STM3941 family protein [Roseibium sp.]|uniref:STM3941 family protein n=1 Tax=Roseibium sp. TaxID=1936156 RepID=UPI003BAEC451
MTIDPNETLRFKRSLARTLLLLSLSIPFAGLGYVLTTGVFDAPGSEGDGQVLGIVCMAFFGGLGLFGAIRLLLKPDQAIEIGPEGIRDERISADWLPWAHITGISTWRSRGSSFIMLDLDETFEATLNQSVVYKAYRLANALVGAQGHCLNPMGFGVSFRDLQSIVLAYAEAHGAPAVG